MNPQTDKPRQKIPSELGQMFALDAINFITAEIAKVNKPLADLLQQAYCIHEDASGGAGVDPVDFAEATELYAQLGGAFRAEGCYLERKPTPQTAN